MPREAEDLIGLRFGERLVTGPAQARDYDGNRELYWFVECLRCHKRSEVQGKSLRRGVGCSCGAPGSSSGVTVKGFTAPSAPKKKKIALTCGELKRLLANVSDEVGVYVHLSSERGWSMQPIKAAIFTGKAMALTAKLPSKIRRKGK